MATQPFSEMEPAWLSPGNFDDLGAATLGVTIVLAILSVLLVILRTWTRVSTGTFGVDDGLMIIGMCIFVACCVSTSIAVYAGLGTRDMYLQIWNQHAGVMYIIYFQITYAWSLPFIKSSICLTMLRIITEKKYRIIIWLSMAFSVASAMIGFIAVVALCTPLEYYWDQSIDGGWCAPVGIITGLSYFISAMSVVTDWTCALLPCVVVWNLQMKSRLKASVCAVLALGMVASAATIVRLPYLQYYNIKTNYLYNTSNIVIWSIIECGIGIVCGSLPSLRSLLKSWLGDKSSNGDSYGKSTGPLGQSGGGGRGHPGGSIKMGYLASRNGGYSTKISAPPRTQGEWVELDDDTGSEKRMITRTVEVTVNVEGEEVEGSTSRH
ncbi:hypothetical protein VM1G_06004 [Cytospora mali]|uniref:Rhodopsin domain-containing protein n=1 Tax=Cytospora mali TaxID=578113 RepID=A0A194W1X6_CYTMA|nr:hypothetical protein VM1G_06004 [Valsa mali]